MNQTIQKFPHAMPAVLGLWSLLCIGLFEFSLVRAFADDSPKNAVIPLVVTVELPRLGVREYHRPYVAVWIEDESRALVQHLAIWYQQGTNAEGHGEKWLPDLRQWWRRGGRKMDRSVDAVSSPTRSVGKHSIRVKEHQLKNLKPGRYNIVVEAAREVGGRELLRLPFTWPLTTPLQTQGFGKTELGQVSIQFTRSNSD